VKLTGAEIFIECLKAEGVDTIFGYPGGAVLYLYDELYKSADSVRHILTRHEQGAIHAAEGYAKSTNKPGVAIVTSGPGATNAVTGIADAYMDSVPLVVFTGQVPRPLIGNDAFQEVDIVGITRPCVKHNFLVTEVEKLAETIKKAFHIATTGRPGPVLVDIPKDLTIDTTEFVYPDSVNMRSYQPTVKGNKKQIKKAVDLILEAKQPVIYSGGGVISSGASKQLTAFARRLNYPITNTLMGLGTYPATDKQFLGMLGMHGTYEANKSMHNVDILIAIGSRFDDRVTGKLEKFCPDARIIHIDIDPASISKNVSVDIPIVGDVKQVLNAIEIELDSRDNNTPDQVAIEKWWQKIAVWRAKECLKYDQASDPEIKAQYVVEKLWEATKGDAYVSSDVGQHQMWAAQFYKFDKPNRWLNSGGLGTMGFGLPAAMGIQLAHPDETVACITGDGSIQMCIQELATCMQEGLPLKIINLNNGFLGMVRQWQEFFYQKRYSSVRMEKQVNPDFVKLAEAYGHVGMRIEKPEDVEGALKEAFAMTDRLVFMDFITKQEANVYPMIPAGAGLNEMILV
jgi:acetolactate synthase-1/2/3 large subunit